MLTAPMASALEGRRPTIIVSTMIMLIQPISARMSGRARRRVGRSSWRKMGKKDIGIEEHSRYEVWDGGGVLAE